jgi:hypothetical protein
MQHNLDIGENTGLRSLNIRLEEIGWALFLMMIGAFWLLPSGTIPADTWLIGAGLIMLGVNFARYFMGMPMSGFTVFVGILALVAGIAGVFDLRIPVFAGLLIVLGASLFLRALFKK